MAVAMQTYRTRQRCVVRLTPSVFGSELTRMRKGRMFGGWPYVDRAWVARAAGGYVRRELLVELTPEVAALAQQLLSERECGA